MTKERELQVVEITPEKTNEEKMKELLEKVNAALVKIADRKKRQTA